MDLKVVKKYNDKITHERVDVGTELKDVNAERAKELIDQEVATELKQDKKTETKQKA